MPSSSTKSELSLASTNDPRLRATFGPLRLLALDASKEYSVGRTADNDFQLVGEFAPYASAWLILHCMHASHLTQVESTANSCGAGMN